MDAQRRLERAIVDGERLVTDAEVLQEILHCYVAIGPRDAIQPAFEALLGVVDEVFPVDLDAVLRARDIESILTLDTGFDSYPGITRLA